MGKINIKCMEMFKEIMRWHHLRRFTDGLLRRKGGVKRNEMS